MSAVQVASKLYQFVVFTSQCSAVYWLTKEIYDFVRNSYQTYQHRQDNDTPEAEIIHLVARRRYRGNQRNNSNTVPDHSQEDDDVQIVAEINVPNPTTTSERIAMQTCNDQSNSGDTTTIVPSDTQNNLPEISSSAIPENVDYNDENASIQSTTETSLESPIVGDEAIKYIQIECFICARPLHTPGKEVAQLPFCMHSFHNRCLDSVLKFHTRCPICNNHIYTPM